MPHCCPITSLSHPTCLRLLLEMIAELELEMFVAGISSCIQHRLRHSPWCSALGTTVIWQRVPRLPSSSVCLLCPTDTALCLQVAAVCKVLGAVEQPAAIGCQSRCSQGGDGGGSKQSGDLQGTAGQGLGLGPGCDGCVGGKGAVLGHCGLGKPAPHAARAAASPCSPLGSLH